MKNLRISSHKGKIMNAIHIILSCVLLVSPAFGQGIYSVYKCPQPNGTILFQKHECVGNAGQEVEVDTRDSGNGKLRTGEIRLIEQKGGQKLIDKAVEKHLIERELKSESPESARTPNLNKPVSRNFTRF
jgi:hypothetical protein